MGLGRLASQFKVLETESSIFFLIMIITFFHVILLMLTSYFIYLF